MTTHHIPHYNQPPKQFTVYSSRHAAPTMLTGEWCFNSFIADGVKYQFNEVHTTEQLAQSAIAARERLKSNGVTIRRVQNHRPHFN